MIGLALGLSHQSREAGVVGIERLGVIAVAERCSQPLPDSPKQLCGQIGREVGGWWATLDSNQ